MTCEDKFVAKMPNKLSFKSPRALRQDLDAALKTAFEPVIDNINVHIHQLVVTVNSSFASIDTTPGTGFFPLLPPR